MAAVLGGRPQCIALTITGRRCNAVSNTGDLCNIHAARVDSDAWRPDRTYEPGIIYALVDRRDGAVRYVGQTIVQPGVRLAGHLHSPPSVAFSEWLAECDRQVDVKVLREGVPNDSLDAAEHAEIKAHLDAGCALVNASGITRPYREFPAARPAQRVRPARRAQAVRPARTARTARVGVNGCADPECGGQCLHAADWTADRVSPDVANALAADVVPGCVRVDRTLSARPLTWYECEDFGLQRSSVTHAMVYRTVQYGASGEVLAVTQTLVQADQQLVVDYPLPVRGGAASHAPQTVPAARPGPASDHDGMRLRVDRERSTDGGPLVLTWDERFNDRPWVAPPHCPDPESCYGLPCRHGGQ